jgi:outer membrane receptor for ferrienterochelin and colicin
MFNQRSNKANVAKLLSLVRGGSRTTLIAFSLFCSSMSVFAQKAVKFSGTVIDGKSRSALVGATIKLIPGGRNILTDVEGKFLIELKQNETYQIEVSSAGFDRKLLTDVNPDSDNGITISLSPKMKDMQEVVVKSSGKKESVASLYLMQRNSSSIQDGISAESIRKSPDKNTGEVIRRVSGVSVQDNKFVVIRGLNERYNVAMLNNNILPSTELDKKAFSFDIIPASAIDNVIIYKTPTADLPGDFSGGLVKVVTKDYPSKAFTEVSVSTTANSLTTGKDFYGSTFNGQFDNFGFFDGMRKLPSDYVKNRGSAFIALPNPTKQQITKQFPNSYKYGGLIQSMPSVSVGISGGNSYMLKNNAKLGMLYMLSYGNGRKVSDRDRSDYMLDGELLYDNFTKVYEQKNNLAGLVNLAYSKGKSKFTLKGLFNNDYSNALGLRNGYDVSNVPSRFEIKSYNAEVTSSGLASVVFDGTHSLNKKLNFDWSTSVSEAYKNQPDQKIISFRTPDDEKGGYYLKLGNENSPEVRNAGRIFSSLDEKIYNAAFNLVYNFNYKGFQQKLKFGSMNFYRDRVATVDALGYASLNFRGVSIAETKATSFSTIFNDANIDAFGITLATIGNNSTSYNANALLNAGYLLYDGKFSEKFKITSGVRAEKYKQQLTAKNQATVNNDNLDVLPSALLTYSIGKSTNLRFAVSKSVNRPEFRELASYSVFDYDNFVVVRGNPSLKRAIVNNADIRIERFPSSGEIMSFSLFYKAFKNPIEQINAGNDVLSFQNAEKATTYGAEFELRKKLDFIGGNFFKDISFYTNLSYMLGSVTFNGNQVNTPLQGQSPYIINSSLSYSTAKNLSLSILYNRVGPRLKYRAVEGGALNIYEMSRDLIDFQFTQKIFKGKVELKFAVVDLLAQPYRWFYKFDAQPSNNYFDSSKDKYINSQKFGTGVNVGVKVNL